MYGLVALFAELGGAVDQTTFGPEYSSNSAELCHLGLQLPREDEK
jgi:hypothetical protein